MKNETYLPVRVGPVIIGMIGTQTNKPAVDADNKIVAIHTTTGEVDRRRRIIPIKPPNVKLAPIFAREPILSNVLPIVGAINTASKGVNPVANDAAACTMLNRPTYTKTLIEGKRRLGSTQQGDY